MASFSSFDTRNYRAVAPREGYDGWAATYEETVEDAMDVALPERLEVHERVVDDEWVALKPKAERFRRRPISLGFVWSR